MRAMILEVIEGRPLLQVSSGSGQFSQKEQGGPQRVVGLQEERTVLDLLGQGEQLLPQLRCLL